MKRVFYAVIMVLALIMSSCVAHAPRTCSSEGYAKGSAEYNACINKKQQQNYYTGSGIGGGGP